MIEFPKDPLDFDLSSIHLRMRMQSMEMQSALVSENVKLDSFLYSKECR